MFNTVPAPLQMFMSRSTFDTMYMPMIEVAKNRMEKKKYISDKNSITVIFNDSTTNNKLVTFQYAEGFLESLFHHTLTKVMATTMIEIGKEHFPQKTTTNTVL